MAELYLTRAECKGSMPNVCMQCGAPATTVIAKHYSTADGTHTPIPEFGSLFLMVLWPIIAVLNLIIWLSKKDMTVMTPLCHKHAYSWFAWTTLSAKSMTDDGIVLTGVSEEFVAAREPSGQRMPALREAVKVRCGGCRSLNEETARYCNQCGMAV